MTRAAGATIAACGPAATRLREVGLGPDLVPLQPTAEGLAAAMDHLGMASGQRVAVVGVARAENTGQLVAATPLQLAPEQRLARALVQAGAEVTLAASCALSASVGVGVPCAEMEWLMAGKVDALIVGSAEEAFALASMLPPRVLPQGGADTGTPVANGAFLRTPGAGGAASEADVHGGAPTSAPVGGVGAGAAVLPPRQLPTKLVAAGAAAAEGCRAAGLCVGLVLPQEVSEPQAVVAALAGELCERKLLW